MHRLTITVEDKRLGDGEHILDLSPSLIPSERHRIMRGLDPTSEQVESSIQRELIRLHGHDAVPLPHPALTPVEKEVFQGYRVVK